MAQYGTWAAPWNVQQTVTSSSPCQPMVGKNGQQIMQRPPLNGNLWSCKVGRASQDAREDRRVLAVLSVWAVVMAAPPSRQGRQLPWRTEHHTNISQTLIVEYRCLPYHGNFILITLLLLLLLLFIQSVITVVSPLRGVKIWRLQPGGSSCRPTCISERFSLPLQKLSCYGLPVGGKSPHRRHHHLSW